MKRVLWVPTDMNEQVSVIDLDSSVFKHYEGVKEGDPYRVGQMLHEQLPKTNNGELGSKVWQEKVNTSRKHVYLFVDESGLLTDKPVNRRAGVFYPIPHGIRGDVMICFAPLIDNGYGDGPDYTIQDMDNVLQLKIIDSMSLVL